MGIPEDKGAEKFLGTLNRVTLPVIGENDEPGRLGGNPPQADRDADDGTLDRNDGAA
jgi:hypothetical protein